MNSVFVIEQNVDYEGDTLISIHATREGALSELNRRHAEATKLGEEYLGEMQLETDNVNMCIKSAYFRFRDGGFYMSEKTLEA
tara:strand:+ start:11 stop:259 length:249 start_codon:yes stop_codon:yes gene_type:complete